MGPGSKNSSSFTPQQSFGPKRVVRNRQKVLVDVSISIVFVLTVLLAGAAMGYRYYLEQNLASMQESFSNSINDIDETAYNKIREHDRKVRAAMFLLESRTLHAPIFAALENTTARDIAYQSFQSRGTETGGTEILLGAISEDFADLVVQARSYTGEELFADRRLSQVLYSTGQGLAPVVYFDFSARMPARMVQWTGEEDPLAGVSASATLSVPDTGVVGGSSATSTEEASDAQSDTEEVSQ